MPSSIARLISVDHDRLLRLLRRTVTEGPSQRRWRDEVVHLASAHRAAERGVLTTEAVDAAGDDAARAAAALLAPDDELDRLVVELARVAVPSDRLLALGDQLRDLVERHAELAGTVLVRLESAVPRKEIRRLGGEYEARRDAHLHRLGAEPAPPRRLDLSRAELYELARRAGVKGRSAMSRRDLIVELQRRETGS